MITPSGFPWKIGNAVSGSKILPGRDASKINLLEIIETIQGPLTLNRCLMNGNGCNRLPGCPLNSKLHELQEYIEGFLTGVTLADLSACRAGKGSDGNR